MVFGSWSDQRPKLNLQDHVKHVTILWCRLALAWSNPGRVWLPETNVMIHYILSLVSTTLISYFTGNCLSTHAAVNAAIAHAQY